MGIPTAQPGTYPRMTWTRGGPYNHCYSGLTNLTGATTCDCITAGKDGGEEVVDFFGAHVMDIIGAATAMTSVWCC
jgi:hypothetical protein